MSERDATQVSTLQRPINNDIHTWKVYWKAQGQPWRTEPEIDTERQKYLTERRAIVPDIEQAIYPFKDIRLSRADVEWLLATHENGRGPVLWDDEKDKSEYERRKGLDLRGADLRQVDLSRLPLACTFGGEFTHDDRVSATIEYPSIYGVHLEGANLYETHLEGANLTHAHLEEANLYRAHLEEADLRLIHLERAHLYGTHLEGVTLYRGHLGGAELDGAFFDAATRLRKCHLGNKKVGFASLAGVHWNDVNLTVVDWTQLQMLGDEKRAYLKRHYGEKKDKAIYLEELDTAVQANRQLAIALQNQGLNENALHFAYRAQKLQRTVLRLQRKLGSYLFSVILDLLAGYGYRPGRSIIWYLVTIFGFALAYFAIGHLPFFPDAFVFSLTSFHGRGFFPGLGSENSLHNPLVILAAFEAVIGLLIEISFIATFTQRFFGK